MHPLLFLLVLLNLTLSASLSDPGQDEKTALLRFKNSTRSDPLGLLTSWTPLSDHCSWLGVTCDSSARVTALNISAKFQSGLSTCMNSRSGPFRPSCSDPARRLSGQLSSALGQLTELQIISLPFQDLNGEIPAEIWRLEKLQVVDFEGNSFSGTLDSALRFPLGLRVLNLAGNLITGEIPESLSNCVGLETLDLSGNYINGSIPKFVGNFSKLRVLYLSYNLLASSVPVEIGKCRNLVTLDLSGNGLKGEIPSSLGNCSNLKYLLLSSNLLEGSVPFSIGKLRKLQVLDVSRNCLSGAVPAELGDCVDLSVLVLSNQFSVLPNEGLFSRSATDEFNSFQGRLSEKITSLSNLRVVWAPQTQLEGEFPKNWGACKSMEMVNLGGNFLKGEIPTSFALCQNLKVFNVSLNNMTGSLREEIPVTCMSVFDVSGNNLSGVIPKFNYRKCPPSPFLNNDVPAMYLSFLMDRTRRGISLPTFESDGVSLVYHNFRRNGFTGSLPALSTVNFGNSSVYAFLADENYLVGSLNYTLFGKCGYFAGLILSLRNNLISGGVPADIAAMCKCLVVLDVAGNRITGMIPKDIGKLAGLKYLSVARNNLSGPVPVELSQLRSIELLDLSSNSLTGEIPSNLASLRNLSILLLNNNTLYGSIPSAFANATSLSIFNASFNNLSGIYPNASMLRCDSVIGNPLLQSCTALSLSSPPSQKTTESIEEGSPPKSGNSGFGSIEIASVASASSITTVLFIFIVFYIYLRKWGSGSSVHAPTRREVIIFVDIGVPLTYEAVVGATGSFNASNCIGSGGFGATYRAEVSPGVLVAIKRLAIGRIQGVQQFHAEVRTLGRGRHPNLVTLIGYHIGDAEMFLVYNYLPGGNLERFIQERSQRAIDWRMLHKIALDVAKALAYLHHQCVPRILHRDVKPSNILLDNQFNAYLSDFGLARLIGNSETHATTGVAGTFGYVAPEYAMTCRVSDKADVYSYGVVLLELLSDKKALDPSFSPYGNGFNIVAWACMLIEQGREHEFFVEGLWEAAPHDDLVDTLRLGVKCTDSLIVRPAMNHVVRRLKELQPPS